MWVFREFPQTFPVHNGTNLFGHILPSNRVMEINNWLVSCEGQSHSTLFICAALYFHFTLPSEGIVRSRILCHLSFCQLQKKNWSNMRILLCLAALTAVCFAQDAKHSKYFLVYLLYLYWRTEEYHKLCLKVKLPFTLNASKLHHRWICFDIQHKDKKTRQHKAGNKGVGLHL